MTSKTTVQGAIPAVNAKNPLGVTLPLNLDALGNLRVTDSATSGTTVTSFADTVVGIGATVALPAAPVGSLAVTVQNTGPAGTMVRVREAGGPAGSGILLTRFGSTIYDKSIDSLEVEEVAGIATSVATQYQS